MINFFCQTFDGGGGASKSARDVAIALDERGLNIVTPSEAKAKRFAGLFLKNTNVIPARIPVLDKDIYSNKLVFYAKFFKQRIFLREHQLQGVAVVNGHGSHALLIDSIKNGSSFSSKIFICRGACIDNVFPNSSLYEEFSKMTTYDKIIYISEFVRDGWIGNYPVLKNIKSTVISNCVSPLIPSYINRKFNILLIGNVSKVKAQELAIKAASCLPEKDHMSIHILGCNKTKYAKLLQDLAETLNVNLYMHGYQKDVIKYLLSCDLYLDTCINEGVNRALLEAKMVNIPVVAPHFKADNGFRNLTDLPHKIAHVLKTSKTARAVYNESLNKFINS